MRRRNVVPRRAFAFVALSCSLLVAACTKGKEAADSTAAVDTTAVARLTVGRPAPGQAKLPGTLSKPLDSLSGDELYDFTRKLGFGGGVDRKRLCKGSSECNGLKPVMTNIRLDAVDGQDSLSATDVPANGVIAVRALNKGAFADKLYGMPPGKEYEYFLVVLPGSKVAGRWRLEELDTTKGARKHSQVAVGTFKPCEHISVKQATRVNFRSCSDSHMLNDSVQRSGLALQGDDDPIWVTCNNHCCTSVQP